MNFEFELRYRFYCLYVLKFIAVVFELGIFSVINLLARTLVLLVAH